MSFLAAFLIAQTKPAIDPKIAQVWTIAVATRIESGTLRLGRNGNFRLRIRETRKPEKSFQGIFTVGPMPESKGRYKLVQLLYDLPSLRKSGTDDETVKAIAKSGQTHVLGMRLMFAPEVPVLTDSMTTHFVPVNDKAGALKRLASWKPF